MNNKTPFSVGDVPELQMQSLDGAYNQQVCQINAAFENWIVVKQSLLVISTLKAKWLSVGLGEGCAEQQ